MITYNKLSKSTNSQIDYYDPDKDPSLIKIYDDSSRELLYRSSKDHCPLLKTLYCNGNNFTLNVENQSDITNNILLKDLNSNTYLVSKKFSDYYKMTIRYTEFDNARLFLSNSSNNNFDANFFFQTMKLLENGKHPFLHKHIPYYTYNFLSKSVFKGINQLKTQYYNIENNLECCQFYSNSNILYLTNNLLKNTLGITIRTGYNEIINNDIYDLIIPVYSVEDRTYNLKKYNISDEKPILSISPYKKPFINWDQEATETIFCENLINYFSSMYSRTLYEPFDSMLNGRIYNWIKEHPYNFIEIIKNISIYYSNLNVN